jgi:outer membrane protein assembly factor BamB
VRALRARVSIILAMLLGAAIAATATAEGGDGGRQGLGWPQWGGNPLHTGAVSSIGQPAGEILAARVFDRFAAAEQGDPLTGGALLVHYQAPLVDGSSVYMESKSGAYTGQATWQTQTWNEQRLDWAGGSLVRTWTFRSDWKPVPYRLAPPSIPIWEPVFHAALWEDFVYVPGFGGTLYKLAKRDGSVLAHIQPFGRTVNPYVFLTGPLTVDANGSVYYVAVQLDPANPWSADAVDSWMVKVTGGHARAATFASLTPGAPRGSDRCPGTFDGQALPWPPTPDAAAPAVPCGSQRPALNSAPAVGRDGTIYVLSVAHLTDRTAYLLAVNPDLTPKWQASLRERLNDGCNVLLPPNGTPGGCAAGARTGVDPAENKPGSGRILDASTASPVVAPDGSVVLGAFTRYNYTQGHLMKFSSQGQFLASYPFGWDDTPAIYRHDGTWSVITKDNRYGGTGSYCDDNRLCPPERTAADPEAYYLTQLSSDLVPEWRYQNTNTLSCTRGAGGHMTCVSDHPAGFEWCVNAPAVDGDGVVYANSEDGNLYAIDQGGRLRARRFLNLAVGAAYTPVAIDPDGRIYSENFGTLFVLGH